MIDQRIALYRVYYVNVNVALFTNYFLTLIHVCPSTLFFQTPRHRKNGKQKIPYL
jgi:hypothetical protein